MCFHDRIHDGKSDSKAPGLGIVGSVHTVKTFEKHVQLSFFDLAPSAITQRLRDLDLMNTTPSQALQILEELKEYL